MKRRAMAATVVALLVVATGYARADESRAPTPEIGVVNDDVAKVVSAKCTRESQYDVASFYGDDCVRLRITFGPIAVKAGQNDVLIQPVTFEKPMYDGYMVRFKPNLVDAKGLAPEVQLLHLHHGTWLNSVGSRSYGDGPWLASGEEKTIASWPRGYGLQILGSDQWLFLHMVHSATSVPTTVWATYDIDFIERSAAETKYGMRNTKQIWLDVGSGDKFHPKEENYPLNPVYNVHRGFGRDDAEAGRTVCSFPDDNCARYNSLGNPSAQQGVDVSDEVAGWDYTVKADYAGTLVLMGGHLHMGGIRDEVSLVRDLNRGKMDAAGNPLPPNWQERTIHVSDALYWNHNNPSTSGAPPTSWDVSMTGVNADIGWKINVKEGDKIRLNALYDSDLSSWYENMGIVMTWVSPGESSGYDPFDPSLTIDRGWPTTATLPSNLTKTCTPSATTLCVRGQPSHPHYASSNKHGFCTGEASKGGSCPNFPAPAVNQAPLVDTIHISGFTYGASDLFGAVSVTGTPKVKLGQPLTFYNEDAGAYIFHTATSCAYPCTGAVTVDYPVANGGNGSPSDVMDFDTGELGVGLGATNRINWTLTPTRTGTFTYFCRIHPFMRGAFEVVP